MDSFALLSAEMVSFGVEVSTKQLVEFTNFEAFMSSIKRETYKGYELLRLKGQFVGGDETDDLRKSFDTATANDLQVVIVDLEKVSYLNSTALGVLISGHTNFAKRNAKVVLCNLSDSIENIFVVTKLTLVFSIFNSVDDAIANLDTAK